jgi:hypothetical protein
VKEFEVALGTEVFDPSEAEPLRRRSIGQRAADAPDPNDTRIVQFVRLLTGPDIDRIRAAYGLALTAYVPNLAYIERVDAATRRRLGNDELVRAVAPYRPEYKFAGLLSDRLTIDALGDAPIVASLFDGGSIDLVIDALAAAGATDIVGSDNRRFGGLPRVAFRTDDPAVIETAAAIPDIRFLEVTGEIQTTDVNASAMIQSGDPAIAAVWDQDIHGEDQIIGHIELTTPNISHCFFAADAPNTPPGPGHRKIVGLHLPVADTADHSTFTAGCAVGDERGNSGAHPNRGSAWNAKLAASSIVPSPIAEDRDMLSRLNQNSSVGAVIHTNSWILPVSHPAPYDFVAVDVDLFCHTNEDHVVVGSTGNSNHAPHVGHLVRKSSDGFQGAPGIAKNALCVVAGSEDGTSVSEGTSGPTKDGRRKPDIVAVGCGISSSAGAACVTAPEGCATSWATPHAAGAAALVRQYFMQGFFPGGAENPANGFTPSGALIRAVLVNSAVNMSGVAGYPNDTEGWGLLNLDRGLTFVGNGRNLIARDIRNSIGLRAGEEWTQPYNVTPILGGGAQQLRVVLAYTDPPGTTAAPRALVNNLDLEVTDPNGVKYVGNDFDASAGFSRPNSAASGDSLNTIEVVMVAAPVAGVWEVKVRARAVPSGPQGFALAITSTGPPPSVQDKCFVATAVYGDAWHGDVVALRSWRDEGLAAAGLRGAAMRAMSTIYAVLGPPAARVVSRVPGLQVWLRRAMFPALVARIETRRMRQHRAGER